MNPGPETTASIVDYSHPCERKTKRKLLKLTWPPRSGRYKTLIILAVTLSSFSYLLLMLRWHGNTNIWESLYIFPRYVSFIPIPIPIPKPKLPL
jgi:hypothetical protein